MGVLGGKVAIVTGGSAGIGLAAAMAMAREGAAVLIADVLDEAGTEAAAAITASGGRARYVHADMAVADDVTAMVAAALAEWGRLDCAFNNAGIEGAIAPTGSSEEDVWNRVIGVNLTGVWRCMRAEIPVMIGGGSGGSIVNCSSVAGLVGFEGIPAYVASKHGVLGLTKTAALDHARDSIRVNAVCPGVIRTAMVERFTGGDAAAMEGLAALEPVGRLGTPEEVAEAVVWLCSDAASFITGAAVPVDGGFVAR